MTNEPTTNETIETIAERARDDLARAGRPVPDWESVDRLRKLVDETLDEDPLGGYVRALDLAEGILRHNLVEVVGRIGDDRRVGNESAEQDRIDLAAAVLESAAMLLTLIVVADELRAVGRLERSVRA